VQESLEDVEDELVELDDDEDGDSDDDDGILCFDFFSLGASLGLPFLNRTELFLVSNGASVSFSILLWLVGETATAPSLALVSPSLSLSSFVGKCKDDSDSFGRDSAVDFRGAGISAVPCKGEADEVLGL